MVKSTLTGSKAFKIESTIVINGTSFARATSIASKLSSASVKLGKQGNETIASEISSLANSYYSAIETGIAKATGSKKIQEQSGRGLQVDLISLDLRSGKVNVSEVKGSLIQSIIKTVKGKRVLDIKRKAEIELGSTIRIGSEGQSRLTTGYSVNAEGRFVEEVEDLTEVEKFVKYYKEDSEKLRSHLKVPSKQSNKNLRKIILAVRSNLETKAQTLRLPFRINNSQTGVTTLRFTREFILSEADIEYDAQKDTINIDFKYRQAIINDGLKLAAKNPKIRQATKNYNTNIARIIDTAISKLPENPYKISFFRDVLKNIEKELDSKSFSADVIFNEGSVIAYQGRIKVLQDRKDKIAQQTMPSIIDITVLVQGRTRLRMRRGSGEPYPPKIYERTGTFRQSIEAYADFRTNTLNYFYEPYYDSLEKYGYQIQDLVEGSIRSVTQQYFNKQFNLVRTNT